MRLLLATVCALHAQSVDAQGPQSYRQCDLRMRVLLMRILIDRLRLVDRVVTVVRCTTFGDRVKEGWWYEYGPVSFWNSTPAH